MPSLRLPFCLLVAVAPAFAQGDGTPPPGHSNPLLAPGAFNVYGTGCPGSGGTAPGKVSPSAYAAKWGESANYFPHGKANMRYQQVHNATDLAPALVIRGLAFRLDEQYGGPAGSKPFEVLVGYSANTAATMSTTFAQNYKGTMTSVFKGTLNYPQHGGNNTNLSEFKVTLLFTRPWVYTAQQGNLLWEALNTGTSDTVHFFDWAKATGLQARRVWAFSTTAATGSRDTPEGALVTKFLTAGSGGGVPVLGNTGRPIIGQSFSIDLSNARPSTAAVLLLGAQKVAIDLTAAGAAGCTLLTSIDAIGGLSVSASGTANAKFAVPNSRTLLGVKFWNQFAIVDPQNTLGLVFSNGGEALIGDS